MSDSPPVVSTWSFDVTPDQLDGIVARIKEVLKHLPAVPGWLGTDCFANETRTRLLMLTKWESKDAWGRSVWDKEIGENLADFISESGGQQFELYVHVAP